MVKFPYLTVLHTIPSPLNCQLQSVSHLDGAAWEHIVIADPESPRTRLTFSNANWLSVYMDSPIGGNAIGSNFAQRAMRSYAEM